MISITRTEDIGPAVRRLRGSAGLSQFALSERCGIAPTHIGRIERGETMPNADTLIRLVVGCGQRMAFLDEFNAVAMEQALRH